jgi:ER-bound oxygenase mpaB/B'/Rubber oxygenase, catalytic domain
MPDLTRRRALTLGVALGLAGAAVDLPKAWAWSSKGSIAGTDTTTDPFTVFDTAADPVVASLFNSGQVPAVNTAFQSWIHNSDPLPSGIPANLTTYLEQVNALPSWANPTLLAQAQVFNQKVNTFLFVSYGLGSGVLSTAIPAEAVNVYYSAGGADMRARAAKTFTFGYDLTAADAFGPSGSFIVTANKTRLVHSAVRWLLPSDSEWVTATVEPTPISNGDILRTFASVGTFAYNNLHTWGIPVSASDAAAWLHSWQVALWLLGVEEQFIPQTWADAQAQALVYRDAHSGRGHRIRQRVRALPGRQPGRRLARTARRPRFTGHHRSRMAVVRPFRHGAGDGRPGGGRHVQRAAQGRVTAVPRQRHLGDVRSHHDPHRQQPQHLSRYTAGEMPRGQAAAGHLS